MTKYIIYYPNGYHRYINYNNGNHEWLDNHDEYISQLKFLVACNPKKVVKLIKAKPGCSISYIKSALSLLLTSQARILLNHNIGYSDLTVEYYLNLMNDYALLQKLSIQVDVTDFAPYISITYQEFYALVIKSIMKEYQYEFKHHAIYENKLDRINKYVDEFVAIIKQVKND